ncbi:CubicO group peptidase (beta-lactamase class C family) [Nocardioides zeae]|uniref:CubicO group peptidase (Beta-lactamase class C family) n=3 Tax=Nocardioides zeae TaxID=1457234 RepID=A0AAJ1U3B2_9ACTN|nr:serine hydrolase domain-containing protein [Nocardioides zeae]MDQ1106820.1 CubicO group peptidase (beta-lactamase class C family) [Nocardioides zeae]MDR6173526.1 CubicO group peptidase (beta-lactamase class C family) [Nocardioides zeae]MDR6210931.1 CubicO group peptidase (beta-lactamase class C family) [Nocardioides zeae]
MTLTAPPAAPDRTPPASPAPRGTTSGMSNRQLHRLTSAIEADIERGLYHGAVVKIARHGEVVLDTALGSTDVTAGRHASRSDVFRVLSVSKALTNTLVYNAIDRGLLSFNTRVVDVIPEFLGHDRFLAANKERVTLGHLLTHRAGMVVTPEPLPYRRLGDLSDVVAAICELPLAAVPGSVVNYSPALNHALMGEMCRRVNGDARFSDSMQREVLDPLGMTDTAFGLPERLASRIVPIRAVFGEEGWLTASDLEILNEVIDGDAEMPWVGSVTTAHDLFLLAEMYRRNGLDESGEPLLSRAVIDKVTRVQTGDEPNDLYRRIAEARGWEVGPGNLGFGFALSGTGVAPSFFGTMTSPRTFGNYGAGSTLFWVDPENDVTFVCLTAGAMEEGDNVLRFQRLSDLAISAVV